MIGRRGEITMDAYFARAMSAGGEESRVMDELVPFEPDGIVCRSDGPAGPFHVRLGQYPEGTGWSPLGATEAAVREVEERSRRIAKQAGLTDA